MRNIWKIYFVLLFIVVSTSSCSNDDKVEPIFENAVDERVQKRLSNYKKILVAPEFGWKIAYQPTGEFGVFNIYIKFNEDGTTIISSDSKKGVNDLPSKYRISISQFPELVLENYTVFHELFEVNNFGLGAEFEFLFEDVQPDRVLLKSKTDAQEKSEIILEKASANDKISIENLRGLDDRISNGFGTDLFFRSIKINSPNGQELASGSFSYNFEARTATIQYLGSQGDIVTEVIPIILTQEGFDFVEPVSIGGQTIKNFIYDELSNTFVSNVGGILSTVLYSNEPGLLFFPESNTFGTRAGFEFYIYFDSSSSNFLRQTSQNFLNLGLASGFSRLDLRFNDVRFGGISYFEFEMNNGDTIFAIFEKQVTENEKITFNFSGIATDPQDADFSGLTDMFNLLFDPNGWYVERTNESRFSSNPSFLLTNTANPEFRFSVYGI